MLRSAASTRGGFVTARRDGTDPRGAPRLGSALEPNGPPQASARERQLVEVAPAIAYDLRVPVLDELMARLGRDGGRGPLPPPTVSCATWAAIVYISHRPEEVFRLADRITVLRDGGRGRHGRRRRSDTPDVRRDDGRPSAHGATRSGKDLARHRNVVVPPRGRRPRDRPGGARKLADGSTRARCWASTGLPRLREGRSSRAHSSSAPTVLLAGRTAVDGRPFCAGGRRPAPFGAGSRAPSPEDRDAPGSLPASSQVDGRNATLSRGGAARHRGSSSVTARSAGRHAAWYQDRASR